MRRSRFWSLGFTTPLQFSRKKESRLKRLADELIATMAGVGGIVLVSCLPVGCCPASRSATALGGSSVVPTTSASDPDEHDAVRAACTDAWAQKLLGNEYVNYRSCAPTEKRKNAFAILFERLDRASRSERISGNQCLDLLGPPDEWLHPLSGEIVLVYHYSFNGRAMAAVVGLDSIGYIKYCGTNTGGALHGGR